MSSENIHSERKEKVLAWLESSERLERLGDAVRPAVAKAVGEGRRRDVLTGRWLTHPAHPAAVMIPISCWFGAAILDVIGGRRSRSAARRLIGAGVISAIPAAATGSADWLDTRDAERRVGSAHALTNNVAVVVFAWSWALRRRGFVFRAQAVSLLATAAVGFAGFLGGHLSYRRGVGVNTTAFQSGPEDWTTIDVPSPLRDGEPAATAIDDVALVVVQRQAGDDPCVLESRCTHRGGPLDEGTVEGNNIVCPWHGSRFDLTDGRVVQGPASVPQPSYEVARDGTEVRIRRQERGSLRRNPLTAADIRQRESRAVPSGFPTT